MKKISVLLCLMLMLAISVSAAQSKIVDDAGLLSQSHIAALEEKAEAIADRYDMDAVIVTVNSLDGRSAQAYADDYFDHNGYGIGNDYSGILLLLAMDEREWAVSTCGDAMAAVRNSEIDDIVENILDDLSDGSYYRAFDSFLAQVENEYEGYASGTDASGFSFKNILIALVIGAAVGLIVLLILRGKMNTAKPQHGARNYMTDGSYDLFRCHDIYLYSHTSRTQKAESSSGSHRSSSSRSHGGSSGRF